MRRRGPEWERWQCGETFPLLQRPEEDAGSPASPRSLTNPKWPEKATRQRPQPRVYFKAPPTPTPGLHQPKNAGKSTPLAGPC